MNRPVVSRVEHEMVVEERDRYYLRNVYLERRNRRLGEMLNALLDARDEFCRLHRMTQVTGDAPVEPPYPRVGVGDIPTEKDTP